MNRRIGRYDRRLTVESATLTDDGYGVQKPTWATLLSCWGYVRPTSGRETVQGAAVLADATVEVGLRGSWPTVRATMRIVDAAAGRAYEIVSALLDEERRDTLCMCRTVGRLEPARVAAVAGPATASAGTPTAAGSGPDVPI